MFNPFGFDWFKTEYDIGDFMNWIWCRGGVFVEADKSWETWWKHQYSCLSAILDIHDRGFWELCGYRIC